MHWPVTNSDKRDIRVTTGKMSAMQDFFSELLSVLLLFRYGLKKREKKKQKTPKQNKGNVKQYTSF